MRRLLIAFVLLALMGGLVPAAAAETNGRISGTVTNGTTGQPLAGATVTASRFDQQPSGGNMPQSVDVTTATATDGSYPFEGLDTSDGLVYAISVNYQGVLYSSGMVQISSTPEQTSDISVYETTPDQSAITLSSRGLLLNAVDRETGAATITDVFSFDNTGNMTVVAGDDGRTLRFSVPSNAAEVGPRAGFDFGTPSLEGTTVYATSPLRPGVANPASFNYIIPYSGSSFEITIAADYPTDDLRILLPADADGAGGGGAGGPRQVLDQGVVPIGGGRCPALAPRPLAAGDSLSLRFVDLPATSAENRGLSTIEPAVIAIIALLAAAATAGWVVSRRKLYAPRPVVVAPVLAETLDARRAALTDELRGLEAAHAAGDVEEEAYRTSRRMILEDLRRISRSMRGIGDDE